MDQFAAEMLFRKMISPMTNPNTTATKSRSRIILSVPGCAERR